MRDPGFAQQAARVIERLDERAATGEDDRPWFLVTSLVNPHDIVFAGPLLRAAGWFPEFYDLVTNHPELLPHIEPPPTFQEALQSKPRVQQDYVLQYPRMYMPQPTNEVYWQFYYWLMAQADAHFGTVYRALKASRFFADTIVVLTSDHGDVLGAHGGMQQKWHNAYEECIYVSLIIANPTLLKTPKTTDVLTSHLDVFPTVLGLADINQEQARARLAVTHTEAQTLVGRDLSALVLAAAADTHAPVTPDEAIYFMTDDQVSLGLQQVNALQQPYRAVIQPNSVETVLARLPEATGVPKLWKYSRYFDNPRFSAGVGGGPGGVGVGNTDAPYTAQATERPVPDEWECYNLDDDAYEQRNLLSPLNPAPLPPRLAQQLQELLPQQRLAKRKLPQVNNRLPAPHELAPLR